MIKNRKNTFSVALYIFIVLFSLTGCEDVINIKTEKGPELLVVDGWINNQSQVQKIKLSYTGGYFDNQTPKPALQASVIVTDSEGKVFEFTDTSQTGTYLWIPSDGEVAGKVGNVYTLTIKLNGEVYTATNEIKRVPPIDSLIYRPESFPFKPEKGPQEGFVAEFFARDPKGAGDCYWIKSLKDGKPYKPEPRFFSIAYDAAFNAGAATDGLIFILPIRTSITIQELFSAQDSVGVELHSITQETFNFLQLARQESTNGGLLAVPSVNLPTNIKNTNPAGKAAVGFFGTSAISRAETRIDPALARPKQN